MLTTPKLTLMQELIAGSSREELIWLSGYLAGVVSAQGTTAPTAAIAAPAAEPTPAAPAVSKITIAYGTETGNSKKLASDFAAKAKKKGINAKLVGLEQYRLNDLSKEEYFITVISTQGDGEPPAAAKKFYDHIHQGGLKLERLKYGVLALGDTAYPLFCKAGEDVDQQLHKAGGQRLVSLEKCDTDYESQANNWFETLLQRLNSAEPAAAPTVVVTAKHTGKKVYTGTVLANINLNDRGSAKQTHHVEITAEGLDYLPGDSLGLVPENPAATVDAIFALTGADPDRKLTLRGEETTIGHLLRKKLNIVYLPERVVKKYAGIVQQDIPETRIGLLDLLKIYPVKDAAQFQEVVSILEPTAPRLYSISSSPEAHSGEIHLTVCKDKFSVNGEVKFGLCSDLLSQLAPDQTLEFYIHKNSQFRLPAPDKDVIMIGPGTGVAPFRSFLAQRDSTGAGGRNWLFFGDQHFTTDFLYQTEMQNWLQTGVLTKLNTAFSRDQAEKVYVQHKMQREAHELYRWLEDGAHVYVCGAKDPMSTDVEAALLGIIQQEGKKTQAQAESYLDELKETGRYVKDVY
ncbi:MAG: flavodoxin domain-containing protein [Bacteroidetes bacterium]|nr:flavodoxin domain-containing protein [Bacteroidota bacterium]